MWLVLRTSGRERMVDKETSLDLIEKTFSYQLKMITPAMPTSASPKAAATAMPRPGRAMA